MVGINDILTELVEYAIDRVYEQLEDPEPSARISGYTITAIANTAEQIKAQQRERVEELEKLLSDLSRECLANDFNEHWESYKQANAALKELEAEGD